MLIDMNQPEIDVRPIRQMTGDREFVKCFSTVPMLLLKV